MASGQYFRLLFSNKREAPRGKPVASLICSKLQEMKKSHTSKKSGTDFKRLKAMRDEDIDFSDLPEATSEMFARGVVRPPLSETDPREQLTVMIDRDVFKWFKSLGPGYSGIINFVLRRYMQEELRKPARPKARRA